MVNYMIRNLLCQLGWHKWEYRSADKRISTASQIRECLNCNEKQECTYWWGVDMDTKVIKAGKFR